ncbi:MAG: transporter substrate-binding protein [Betaproteobacteria bacterium]|nr:transporter substrate-binding protein [Betaproteobacteria bacterium]
MPMMKSSAVVIATALLSGNVLAQGYPAKPVRIVVPYPAGGTVDIVARMIGQRLTETLGRTFLVDNRSGASGNIGTEFVAKSPPDGYTLLMSSAAPLAANPAFYPKLPFQPLKDFSPVTLIVIQPNILVVNPAVPARTIKEFIALAKARPGALNYGSSGVGNSQHMAAELFRYYTHVNITHVPYKGGAPALTDLVGGQIDLLFEPIPGTIPYVRSGRLRALGVTTRERSETFPDVPAIREAGLPDYEYRGWIGLLAPAGTPPEIVDTLHAEVVKALHGGLAAKLKEFAFVVSGSGAQEFGPFIRKELELHQKIVKAAGIKPE